MKQTLLIAVLFISLQNYAQQNQVIVKLSPLSLVDVINFPTIQAGIETRWNKIGWYNEFGIRYLKYSTRRYDTSFVPERGFKIKTELRYYFSQNVIQQSFGGPKITSTPSNSPYVAINFFYIYDSHNNKENYNYNADTSQPRTDDFGVKKTVWGFNILLGQQIAGSKHWMIDTYAGLGIRFRNIHTNNIETQYNRDSYNTPIDYSIPVAMQMTEIKGGSSVAPNLTLGIRIGYRF